MRVMDEAGVALIVRRHGSRSEGRRRP
jgi:hypothetical protein